MVDEGNGYVIFISTVTNVLVSMDVAFQRLLVTQCINFSG